MQGRRAVLVQAGPLEQRAAALSVAAAYCNFNHEVMYNNAGVICVFTEKRMSLVKNSQ